MKKVTIFLLMVGLHLNAQIKLTPSESGLSSDPYLISSFEEVYWISYNNFNTANFLDSK
jgi:hypothetical protein